MDHFQDFDGSNSDDLEEDISDVPSEMEEFSQSTFLDEKLMKQYEEDLKFKLKYGTSEKIPKNFQTPTTVAKINPKNLFRQRYKEEGYLFQKFFCGCLPKIVFSTLKRPDKQTIKKWYEYIKIVGSPRSNLKSEKRKFMEKIPKYVTRFISEMLLDIEDLNELYQETRDDQIRTGLVPLIDDCFSLSYLNSFKAKSKFSHKK